MHHCLRIPEIIGEIVQYCSVSTSCVLALTCRTFNSPAEDVIWESLDSFLPLVWCMPPSLLESSVAVWGTQLNFTCQPTPAEWQMFAKHAHRVKTLYSERESWTRGQHSATSSERTQIVLGDKSLNALHRFICQPSLGASESPLFSNLVSLEVPLCHPLMDYKRGQLPKYLPFLAGKNLKALKFQYRGIRKYADSAESAPGIQICRALATSYPNLQDVDVQRFLYDVTGPISGLEGLRSLSATSTWAMADGLLVCLSTKPDLRFLHLRDAYHALKSYSNPIGGEVGHSDLSLHVNLMDYNFRLSEPHYPFAALKDLSLDRMDTELVVQLMGALGGSKVLRSITAIVTHGSWQQLANIFTNISTIEGLEAFSLYFRRDDSRRAPPQLTGKVLRELCTLQNLRKLMLKGIGGMHINDEDLACLAKSCPLLEEVSITVSVANTGSVLEPHVTLPGLAALRNACPSIRSIEITVRGSLPLLAEHIPPICPQLQPLNLALDYQSSTLDLMQGATYVAKVLLQLFPKLEAFTGVQKYWEDVEAEVQRLRVL